MEDPPCARARGHDGVVAADHVAAHALDADVPIYSCLPFADDNRTNRTGILARGASNTLLSNDPRPDGEQTQEEL